MAGLISKQNVLTSLVLAGYKMSKSLYPPARILNICIEALPGFSHVIDPNGLNNTILSAGYVLEMAAPMEWWAKHQSQGRGGSEDLPIAWV